MMLKHEWTRSQRRLLRELSGKAYDRELERELSALEADFASWRRGEIDVHELSDRIHRFHNGSARRLFGIYTGTDWDLAVGGAIGRGVLREEEATPEILEVLKGIIQFARGDLAGDGGGGGGGSTAGSDRRG